MESMDDITSEIIRIDTYDKVYNFAKEIGMSNEKAAAGATEEAEHEVRQYRNMQERDKLQRLAEARARMFEKYEQRREMASNVAELLDSMSAMGL